MENAITIIKGDDTNFMEDQFIVVAIHTEHDLTGFQAKFKLGDIDLTFPDISSGSFEIILSHDLTLNLPKGKMFGEIKLIDTSDRIRTVTSVIPFLIRDGVKDQITYVNQVLSVTTHINNTTIQINMETAGISKSQAESYLAQMQSYSSSILSSANSSQNNSNASYENMVRARNSANDSANSADSANTALETIESIVPTVSPILQNMEELTSVAEHIDDITTVSNNIENIGAATNSYTKEESDYRFERKGCSFSINECNSLNGVPNVLSYSGSTLSFNVDDGTDYEPLIFTTGYSFEQVQKTSLSSIDVSELANGTYNVFVPKEGSTPYLLNNIITPQTVQPANANLIPVMTSATEPYGTVTNTNINNAWKIFRGTYTAQDDTPTKVGYSSCDVTYTFAEDKQPQLGNYTISYVPPVMYSARIEEIVITYTDDTTLTISLNNGTSGTGKTVSFTKDFTATKTIKSFKVVGYSGDGHGAWFGSFSLVSVVDENTIWVDTRDDVVKTYIKDNNGQWQPFNDVLCGTVTVSSGAITSVTQPDFNAYSGIKMHNVSQTAHADIRELIEAKAGILDVPTKTSDLTNDSGFLTSHQDISDKANNLIQDKQPVTNGAINLVYTKSFYISTVSSDTTYTFNTSALTGLTSNQVVTFELCIVMNTVYDLTLPNNITWQDGITPAFDETGVYFLTFRTLDAGTSWYGSSSSQGVW